MGDAGYGLVLILASLGLKKVLGKIAPLGVTLGIATTVVGLLFHTFFSVDMLTWRWLPEGVKRIMLPSKIAGYDGTMVLSLVVGIVHICIAMVVKTCVATITIVVHLVAISVVLHATISITDEEWVDRSGGHSHCDWVTRRVGRTIFRH